MYFGAIRVRNEAYGDQEEEKEEGGDEGEMRMPCVGGWVCCAVLFVYTYLGTYSSQVHSLAG